MESIVNNLRNNKYNLHNTKLYTVRTELKRNRLRRENKIKSKHDNRRMQKEKYCKINQCSLPLRKIVVAIIYP